MTFRVVTPAADRALISIEDARAAAGVDGAGQDAALTKLVLAVSDMVVRQCGVVAAGAHPPSLRVEACEETFRRPRSATVSLSRRFVSITAISEDGASLTADAYDVDDQAGVLTRLNDGRERCWGRLVIVTYDAGFDDVPADLARAVGTTLRELHSADGRDPLLRSESVDGVSRMDYQIGGSGREDGSALPPHVAAMLGPYATVSVA